MLLSKYEDILDALDLNSVAKATGYLQCLFSYAEYLTEKYDIKEVIYK